MNQPHVAIPRQVILHIGTHKTGTKALQVFLSTNKPLLQNVGLHYPVLGRIPVGDDLLTPGHHKVPIEFLADGSSATFEAMLDEIDAANAPTVVLSSEEFQYMVDRPELLTTMAAAFAARGYALHPILYVRAQPYYAESLFAEFAKGGYTQSLVSYFDEILATGAFEPARSGRILHFDYATIVDALDDIAGSGATVVRAYHPEREPEFVLNDFLRTVGHLRGTLYVDGLANPEPRVNQSMSFAQLLIALHDAAVTPIDGPSPYAPEWFEGLPELPPAVLASRFSLLTYADVASFLERFGEGNRAMNQRFEIDIPFTTVDDLPPSADPRFALARIHRDYIARAMDKWSRM